LLIYNQRAPFCLASLKGEKKPPVSPDIMRYKYQVRGEGLLGLSTGCIIKCKAILFPHTLKVDAFINSLGHKWVPPLACSTDLIVYTLPWLNMKALGLRSVL